MTEPVSPGYKPFDPAPRMPDLALPPGACDTHCHVFGPQADFPFAPARRYTPVDAGKDRLFALHRHLGIDRAVLVQASCHGTDNRAMLDAIAASGGTVRGVAMVGPEVTDAELRALHDGGVRGVRFNFVAHLGEDADPGAVKAIAARIADLGWHLVVHFDASKLTGLAPFLRELPVPMIVDHMGRVDASAGLDQEPFRLLLGLLEDERFVVKVCGAERISRTGAPFRDAVPFAARLVELFPERCLWGTDWPHPNIKGDMPDDGHLVDLLGEIAPSGDARGRLLVDNPTRLYWAD